MKNYTVFSHPTKDTLQLQSVGHVLGTPAGEIKAGDVLMWNFGMTSEVTEVVRETPKMIVINVKCSSGKIYERKMIKTRLVCRLSN